MSLAQLHYTSAPPGPDGSGFRFTAVSPGVPRTLLREAEQLIGYEPPRDLPARPDTEELKAFPKAFSCTELSDGGRLLSRSVYTGADYSGRWGNFHTHALYLPPGTRLPDGALPITAWESPRWADATPPDGRPEPVGRFEPSGLLRRDGLVAFARSRADRLAAFFADLAALAGGTDSRQIVVVEHDSADVAQWIALACAVLPRERAHLLTFTTYTRRPQQARQQIVGVLPSCEPVGHDHRFRVHDCTARPDAGPVADAWADVCARIWTAGRPDLFRGGSGDIGPLAVAALATGVPLRADGRAAAARWTADHAPTLPEETLTALIAALTEKNGSRPGTSHPTAGAGDAPSGAGGTPSSAGDAPNGAGSAGAEAWSSGAGRGATGTGVGASRDGMGPTGTGTDATGTGAGLDATWTGTSGTGAGLDGTRASADGSGAGPDGTWTGASGSGAGTSHTGTRASGTWTGAGGSGAGPDGTWTGASGTGADAGGTRRYAPDGNPLDDEPAALAALSARLDGQVPTAVSAPLAARVLAAAVRDRGPLPALGAGSLTPALRAELGRNLAPALRQGVGDPAEPAAGRPLALLRVADLLDVDCSDTLPALAGRLARELVGGRPADPATGREPERGPSGTGRTSDRAPDPGAQPDGEGGRAVCPPAVLDAVHDHPALRTALFGALDALAAADPPAVAGRLAGCGLPVPPSPGFPRLRMCLQTAGAGRTGDRRARFHGLLRTAGVSPHAEPDVLRTAFDLVWPDGPPTAEEAALLLSELGSDAHRLAGTRDLLVEAALAAPADDPAVPVLAADLLRCFTAELRPAHRAPLLLLEYAGLLDGDHDVENWVDHVLGLRDGAPEPVPEPVARRVHDALARRLLAVAAPGSEPYAPPRPPAPESELYALARAGDPGLLAAYERVGRGDRVAERLRTVPGYVAACFCDWSAYPRPYGGWETTRTTLLTKVLRPVVRALPAEDQRAVEEALHRTGRGRLDAYRAWNRPGALGRLAGRLTGRGRREDRSAPWTGDVEPPAGGGRR